MFIRLDNQGMVSIVEDAEATYQATPEVFAADAPDVTPLLPPGYSMVVLETETGVVTGYDAKGNAFPGIEWASANDLLLRATALKAAHAARSVASEPEQIKVVRPKEVVADTDDIQTKTEVTIL